MSKTSESVLHDHDDEDIANRGFVTLGIDTDEDKVRYCYAMACSLKICDPTASITLIVDKDQSDNVPKKYQHVFDYITELPYGNSAYKDGFHGMNLWQVYYASPYQETIYVDYDTLFLDVDINNLWDTMGMRDISVPRNARSYRDFPIPTMQRFAFERQYNLPENFYNMIYWQKDSVAAVEWFKMADPILQNWRDVYRHQFPDKKPAHFEKNLIGNIITLYVDLIDEIGVTVENHYDLHTLSHGAFSSIEDTPERWTEQLNYWVSGSRKIQIENSIISSGIIHYSDENFVTDEVIDVFRTDLANRIQER